MVQGCKVTVASLFCQGACPDGASCENSTTVGIVS